MKQRALVIKGYNATANEYAEGFLNELDGKPLDRLLLSRFGEANKSKGLVLDLACGPGQTTRYLHDTGLKNIIGIDLSPGIIEVAKKSHDNQIAFEDGDMLSLRFSDNEISAVLCFYGIVHFTLDELELALTEIHRVLKPGGTFLFSFHVGTEHKKVDEFLGKPMTLTFYFFETERVLDILKKIGYTVKEVVERYPYEGMEFPSRRAYILVEK